MKKTLLASLLALAGATPALAADNVTLYGLLNVGYVWSDNGTTKQHKIDSLYTGSRIGFKGTEDLGGSTKAFFQIEQHIAVDDASQSGFATREGWVGLQGDFGKFGLGRGKTPYTNLADIFDIFDGSNGLSLPAYDRLTTSRFHNSVRYDTPTMGGVSGALMYSFGENKAAGVKSSDKFSGSLKFSQGPVMVGTAYNQERNLGANNRKNEAFLLGGTFKIDTVTLGAAWQRGQKRNPAAGVSKDRRDAILANVAVDVSQVTLEAGAIVGLDKRINGSKINDSDYVRYALGAKYNLSKRTGAYVEFAGDDNSGGVPDTRFFTLGVIHLF
ncbi:porin [Chitinimonas lacunae]|uniref:Porin n=1 Tax=Chitinimonas lacunae TaxID=1963018 RepID=A0ABV8MJ74_9NEIS